MKTDRNIVLIGFMGTGKTSVGKVLATKTGYSFVDSDEVLVRQEGRDIPTIFAVDGEVLFRLREKEVIASLASQSGQIIATGGGVVLNPENIALLRQSGVIVSLMASAETILQRVAGDTGRPLLEGDDRGERIQHLLTSREEKYRQADIIIQTDRYKTPEEVAEEVIHRVEAFEKSSMRRVGVQLGARSYDIMVGTGVWAQLPKILDDHRVADPLLIVSNPKVADLYLDKVTRVLEDAGHHFAVTIVPDGETFKSLEQAQRLYDAAVEAGLERRSAILALGGGVIGDLTGFIAATYLRGIGFIQLPTTLLAQVDSSVGGKVAVNHPKGKNLIGAFYQPMAVVTDLSTLETLDPADYASGLAEVIKSAAIKDSNLFDLLENNIDRINARDPQILAEIVARVCQIKAEVVIADEREESIRAILNYGHTVGHAVEAVTRYTGYRHGEAVAMGMVAAAEIGVNMGLCSVDVLERTQLLLSKLNLPTKLPALSLEALCEALSHDKKVDGGTVKFILPEAIGQVRWGMNVPEEVLRHVLTNLGAVKE